MRFHGSGSRPGSRNAKIIDPRGASRRNDPQPAVKQETSLALLTNPQDQDSIRARKPMNVWFLGEKIEDLTTYPPLAASFNAISKIYELQHNPKWADLITVKSHLSGEPVSIYNAPLNSAEDANR